MSRLQQVTGQLKFSTDLSQIKENVRILREALKETQAEEKSLRALIQAVYGMCEHKKTRSNYDGGECLDCGWQW